MEALAAVKRYALAAFLLFHCAAVVVPSLPAPIQGDDPRGYESREGQRELTRWSGFLGRFGIQVTNKQLADASMAVAKTWLDTRRAVLKPFAPYKKYAGVRQSWRMFSGVNEEPDRLRIEVKVDGDWQTIFLAGQDEAWHGSMLRHEFGRSMLGRYGEEGRYGKRFKAFTKWMGRLAAESHPDAERVRVTVERLETPRPAEARQGAEVSVRRAKRKSLAIER